MVQRLGPRPIPRGAPRRLSMDTVSEPLSEPSTRPNTPGTDSKRQRTSEVLEPIEERAASSTQVEPGSVAAEAGQGMVHARVREIEGRTSQRSRSPLPEMMRRHVDYASPPVSTSSMECDEDSDESMTRPFVSHADLDNANFYGDFKLGCQLLQEQCYFHDIAEENYGQLPIEHILELNVVEQPGTTEQPAGVWATEPVRAGEITWSQMTPDEVIQFQKADSVEWKDLEEKFQAVKVWRGAEAEKLRAEHRRRILTSRMVRRKKPVPGLHQYKTKSRFCVHGHKDPDSGTYRTFSPTPTTEALNVVCQVIANEGLLVKFADVRAAFAQSDPLIRPQGRLFVEPCDGVPVEKGSLVELLQPVYGLDDAPLRWFETVTSYLKKKLHMKRSLLEPCVFTRHNLLGQLEVLILLEVDDFIVATDTAERMAEVRAKLEERFLFGRWEEDQADYIGRHIQRTPGEVRLDQQKYIAEKVAAVNLGKGRRGNKEALLLPDEFQEYRSMLYRISWVAHQTRPEAAGIVSILSSRLHRATVQDIILLNKLVGHLRSTAKQPLRIRAFRSEEMKFIGVSDAGGVDGGVPGLDAGGLPMDPVQGAWLVLTSNQMPAHDPRIPVSVLSWRSSKLKRRVTSTMAGETLSMSQCLGEVEWLQVFFRDLCYGDVKVQNWQKSVLPFTMYLPEECSLVARQEQAHITDAKSLYDAIYKQCPASRQDRRTALELAVIVDAMQKAGSLIRWSPHQRMPVDLLTKDDFSKTNGALLHLLRTGMLKIDNEEAELLRRRGGGEARSRTRRSSERLLESDEEEYYMTIISNLVWGAANKE